MHHPGSHPSLLCNHCALQAQQAFAVTCNRTTPTAAPHNPPHPPHPLTTPYPLHTTQQTSQDEKLRLRSVGTEVRRARNLRCTICNRSGAALGCRLPSCNRCFHLPCAIEAGASFNFELYLMACPEHAALFKKETTGRAAERRWAPAGDKACIRIQRPHCSDAARQLIATALLVRHLGRHHIWGCRLSCAGSAMASAACAVALWLT